MGEVLTWWLLVSRWTGGGLLSPDVLQYVDAYRHQSIHYSYNKTHSTTIAVIWQHYDMIIN